MSILKKNTGRYMDSSLYFQNNVNIKVIKDTKVINEINTHNLVVDSGLQRVIKYINAGLYDPVMKIAIGAGTTAPANTDIGLDEYLMEGSIIKRTEDTKKCIFEYLLGMDNLNGNALTEAGLLTDDGILFARVVHDAINKSSLIQVLYTWTVNVGGTI